MRRCTRGPGPTPARTARAASPAATAKLRHQRRHRARAGAGRRRAAGLQAPARRPRKPRCSPQARRPRPRCPLAPYQGRAKSRSSHGGQHPLSSQRLLLRQPRPLGLRDGGSRRLRARLTCTVLGAWPPDLALHPLSPTVGADPPPRFAWRREVKGEELSPEPTLPLPALDTRAGLDAPPSPLPTPRPLMLVRNCLPHV